MCDVFLPQYIFKQCTRRLPHSDFLVLATQSVIPHREGCVWVWNWDMWPHNAAAPFPHQQATKLGISTLRFIKQGISTRGQEENRKMENWNWTECRAKFPIWLHNCTVFIVKEISWCFYEIFNNHPAGSLLITLIAFWNNEIQHAVFNHQAIRRSIKFSDPILGPKHLMITIFLHGSVLPDLLWNIIYNGVPAFYRSLCT